ncbi:MAG: lipolytic protein family [Frankiales bacterium]|nr:lipolytic protein family [Frankiales bacterium]
MSRLQAFGDSFTCGEGVGVQVPLTLTWAAQLAEALGLAHVSHAVAGARVRDVVNRQLPSAEVAEVSTLLVGLNDLARGGFDIAAVRAGLLASVARLGELSGTVVLGRLHDPAKVLWMPLPLRQLVGRRLAQVNAVVDEATEFPRVTVVDLAAVPALQQPAGWAVDRVHPSAGGHRALARAAAAELGHELPEALELPAAPGLVRRAVWGARHGAPYLAGQVIGRWI